MRNILQNKNHFILNYWDVIPKSLCERKRVHVHISNISACGVSSNYVSLFLTNVSLIITSHHHYLILRYLSCRTGCEGQQTVSLRLNHGIYHSPLPLFFIKHFNNRRNRIVIRNTTDFVDKSAIKRTACERAGLVIHWLYFLYFVINNIKSLTPVRNNLVI